MGHRVRDGKEARIAPPIPGHFFPLVFCLSLSRYQCEVNVNHTTLPQGNGVRNGAQFCLEGDCGGLS